MKKNRKWLTCPHFFLSGKVRRLWNRLVLILVAWIMMPSLAWAQHQKVSIDVKGVDVQVVLRQIKEQTKLNFVYDPDQLSGLSNVSLNVQEKTVDEVLGKLFKDTPFEYRFEMQSIIIRKAAKKRPGENRKIQGKVTDVAGNVLPGVTVLIAGTTMGCSTDMDGHFILMIPDAVKEATIEFRFLGMNPHRVKLADLKDNAILKGVKEMKVVLTESSQQLQDVVVTGIFNKSKESYTGAVTTISSKELKMFRGQNMLATLKNIDPAFNVLQNNEFGSDPNRLPEVNIRGNSSLPTSLKQLNEETSQQLNAPLVIMDGFEISLQKLLDFNDEEIETISILKDASATAIYGSRGANGVIVLTTKAPEAGQLKLFVSGGVNIEMPDLSSYDLLNAREKLELERMVGLYDNEDPIKDRKLKQEYYEKQAEVARGVDTYWLGLPLRVEVGQRYNLRMDGGSEAFRWGLSLGNNMVAGVMKGSGRNAFNGSITLSYTYDKLLFRNSLMVSFTKGTESKYGAFSDYANKNPYLRTKDENGEYIRSYGQSGVTFQAILNPLYNAQLDSKNENKGHTLTNNFSIDWSILEELTLRGQIGLSRDETTLDNYKPADHTDFNGYQEAGKFYKRGSYSYSTGQNVNIDGNLTLSYSKAFAEKHQVYAGLNYSISQQRGHNYSFVAEGFPNERLDFFASGIQYQEGSKPAGSESTSRRVSFTGNANYSYDNRYYADFSYSMDGSSQFGKDKKFAPFWSVGIGWNMHHEKFLAEHNVVNNLKIRASYGETGSQQFTPYQALETYKYYSDKRYLTWTGAELQGIANSDLKWQITDQLNVGFDLSLLNNRISASLDVYSKKTSNLLSNMDLPLAHGFNTYAANVGEVKNKGFEASLSGYLIRNTEHGMIWSVTGKISHDKTEITELSEAIKAQNETYRDRETSQLLYEGYSQNAIWAVPSLGIDPSSGDELFLDENGNVTKQWLSSAKRYFGESEPKYRGNISTYFSFGNFSVNLSFAYRFGGQQYNTTLIEKVEVSDSYIESYNVDRRVLEERWQKPGDVKFFKGYGKGSTQMTSRFVMDDNTFEFQSANLQYRWDAAYLKKSLGVENINLSVNMSDIFYISSIKRERGTAYPFARALSFDVSLMF